MRRIKSIVVFVFVLLGTVFLTACGGSNGGSSKKEKQNIQDFLSVIEESFELLSDYSDDIYKNWYDAIYNKKFSGNINLAILSAQIDHEDDILVLEENDEKIVELYKNVRESKLADDVKALKNAYDEFYDFVMNVSGSFNTYSASKENLKKELSRKIKALKDEI